MIGTSCKYLMFGLLLVGLAGVWGCVDSGVALEDDDDSSNEGSDGDTDGDSDGDTDTDSDADADADADTDTDTDVDTDTDTDADDDTDTGFEFTCSPTTHLPAVACKPSDQCCGFPEPANGPKLDDVTGQGCNSAWDLGGTAYEVLCADLGTMTAICECFENSGSL